VHQFDSYSCGAFVLYYVQARVMTMGQQYSSKSAISDPSKLYEFNIHQIRTALHDNFVAMQKIQASLKDFYKEQRKKMRQKNNNNENNNSSKEMGKNTVAVVKPSVTPVNTPRKAKKPIVATSASDDCDVIELDWIVTSRSVGYLYVY